MMTAMIDLVRLVSMMDTGIDFWGHGRNEALATRNVITTLGLQNNPNL